MSSLHMSSGQKTSHVPLRHRQSRVRANPSSGRWSQGPCHHQKSLTEGVLLKIIDEIKNKKLEEEAFASGARGAYQVEHHR